MKPPPIRSAGDAHRRRLRGLLGVDHGGFGKRQASIAAAESEKPRHDTPARSAREIFLNIDVLCTVRLLDLGDA